MKAIPYGRQHITEEDIQAVVETLKSDYLTQGPKIKEFEKAFANILDVNMQLRLPMVLLPCI
jgi:dTDP-4-amino-4,6-dideoxygalactose transaminase